MLATFRNRLAAVEASNDGGLTWRRVETPTFVIVDVRDQLPSGGAFLHRDVMKASGGSHLLEREQALPTQAAEAVLEAVLPTDMADDDVAESVRYAGTQTSGVQDLGDLHVGVIVDQAIDFGDDCRMRLAQFWR